MLFCILGFFFSKVYSQTVTATQVDSLVGDHQTQGVANPKDTLRYKTKISVTGANATGVNFNNMIPNNTTMVGTVKTSALCRDDVFATSFNTMLNMGNVLTNDFGLPSVSVVSFGTTMSGGTTTAAGNAGTTNGGGTLTLNANGTFSYQPMMGFSGVDQFAYIGTTGVAGLQNGSAIVTINVAADITFTTMDVQPSCNGGTTGSITFSANGGTGALMYSITGPMGAFQISPVFSGLGAGTYNLAVKDAVNYTKTGSTTLTDPPLLSFTTMEVNNPCNGVSMGSIAFSATGGTGSLMYSITGAMGTFQMGSNFSGLAANTYNLAVKDANNCIATGMATITEPAPIGFTFSKTDISCNGAGDGSITFNSVMGGTSPYTYSINGSMGTFTGNTMYSNLAANTYNLVVKDNMGCNSAAQATTIIEPAAIVVSGTIPTLTYNVAMASATFTKTGGSGSPATPWSGSGFPSGVSINTSTGIVSGTPTQTGMFTATITYIDANGCTDDIMVSFNVAPRLIANTYAVVGNTQLVSNGHSTPATPHTTDATNILTNDESDAAITITAGTFSTTNMGSITIGSDGKFIYTPPAGSTVADSYTYTGTSNGVSATATITFNITNMVWYVNNTFGGTPDGRSNAPFTTCNAAASASDVNQIIYVHTGSGNTTGNTVLKSGQTLRGAGNALTVGALTIPAGTKPTLSGTVTLANSVNVDGFDMSTGSSTAIASSGATTVSVSIGNVTTSGAANAINLVTTTGTVIIAGGTITGGAGAPVNINGGTVSLTYSGSASQATAGQPLVSISGGHTTGTVTFNTGTLSATDGTGLQFNDADGTYNVSGSCTLNGGDAGIDIINGSSGSFTFSNVSITNPSGTAFNVNSSTPSTINCSGALSKNSTGRLIDVSSNSGGTITFNNTLSSTGTSSGILVNSNSGITVNFAGTTKTFSTGSNTAVSFTSNSGSTANFTNGGLDITVTSGTGFNATGGGTVSVTGSNNTIVSTTGTALNISGSTIGSNNINFKSISNNGATNGIVLNNTGTSGGLIVTGTGFSGTGGTLALNSGDAIVLNSTRNVSLSYMSISSSGQSWIDADNVTNLSLIGVEADLSTLAGIDGNSITNLTMTNGKYERGGIGNSACNINGIYIVNLLGVSTVTGTQFRKSNTIQFRIENNTATNFGGTADQLTVSGTVWDTHNQVNASMTLCAGDHLSVHADAGGNFKLIMNSSSGINKVNDGGTFSTGGGSGVQATCSGTGKMEVSITGLKTQNNTAGVALGNSGTGHLQYNIFNNNVGNGTGFSSTGSVALILSHVGSGTSTGTISNNTINHTAGTSTNALQVVMEGNGVATTNISNNNISGNFQRGIQIQSRLGTGSINATVNSNILNGTDAMGLQGINIETGGSGSGHGNSICLNMLNNNVTMAGGLNAYRLFNRSTSNCTIQPCSFLLQNFSGSGSSTSDISNWISTTKGNLGAPILITASQAFGTSPGCPTP